MSKNVWAVPQAGVPKKTPNKSNKPKSSNGNNPANGESAKAHLEKFKEAQKKHIAAAQKHYGGYASSSDEEELENNSLFESVFKGYGGDTNQLRKTQEFLENVFQSGAATCLICIATVKRTDYIWSCDSCYSFFHLNCIQRWANDSTSLKKMNQELDGGYYTNEGVYIPKQQRVIKWCCPKCRTDYKPSEIPREYVCFCKKELNPQNHPWLVPHSCGEICRKQLMPDCGHRCVLLCHPGPCPPCPQMVSVSCECGQSNLKMIRCSQKSWKCGKKCNQKLACGIHACGLPCHKSSECPPCMKKSQQKCECGNKVQERNCNSLMWHCEKKCNKFYGCTRHRCDVKCHAGPCGECPFGLPRSCPCGKEMSVAPCSEEIGPCGNTCQKTLECGNHICAERCHKGDCSQCLEIVEKKCRCGLYSKELPCSKPYSCESKCKRMRDCNKHACNRKCCDNQCPPCDKICGKLLSCGKHKCTSLCHNGLCYPCSLRATVKCRCGNTSMSVPCGREKKTKPPKCTHPCKFASKCHHINAHKCHMGDCPECRNPCLLPNDVTGCEHPCPAKCHDAVKVLIVDKNFKPAGPWDVAVEKYEVQKQPHPPCETKVPVDCIGGHENALWPCWNSKPGSCGRNCGRALKCGHHVCERPCHEVADSKTMAQDPSCTECRRQCIIPRPHGCIHPCQRRCHMPPCDECNIITKTACHCGLSQVHFKCGKFNRHDANPDELRADREKQLSCGNRCIKNYACGHRCVGICHSGKCPSPDSCRKKLKVYCDCKNRKVETTCDKIRAGFVLGCDEACTERQKEAKKIADEASRAKLEQELEKNRQEVEEFEKKFGKKKYKERKRAVVEQDNKKQYVWIGAAVGAIALAVFVYYLFAQ